MKRILSLILAISMIITMTTLCASAQNDYSASGIADNITVTNDSTATVMQENDGSFGTALKISVPKTNAQNVYFTIPEAIASGVAEVSFDVRLQDWTKCVEFYANGATTSTVTNPQMARMHYFYGSMYGMGLEDGSFKNTKMRDSYVTCRFIINLDTKERKSYAGDGVKTYDASKYPNFYKANDIKRLSVNFNTNITSGNYDENKENNVLWIKNVSVKPYALSAATDIENGEIGISDGINVSFNEPVSAEKVTSENFILSDNSGNSVSSALTPSEDYKTVTVKPEADLAYNEAYTLTVKNSVTSAYANAMNADYVESFTTKKAENKIILNETFDNEEGGILTIASEKSKQIDFSEVKDEKVLVSYDMKLAQEIYAISPSANFVTFIVNEQSYPRFMRVEWNQIMVNRDGLNQDYFTTTSNFSDFKNITAVIDLKNKKIEALYCGGVKQTKGYIENITYNTFRSIIFRNPKPNGDSGKNMYIDNVKVMTLNANYVTGTSIENGANVSLTQKAFTFNFFEAPQAVTADNFIVYKNDEIISSDLYSVTSADNSATVTFNSDLEENAVYKIVAKAGITGTTLEPTADDYTLSFTAVMPENEVVLDETFDNEADGCLTLAYGENRNVMLPKTVTDERALISYDMKIDPGYIGYVNLTRSIASETSYQSLLWMEWNQITVPRRGVNQNFASVGDFADFKNIKIIMNLKTKKIESLYYDGVKQTKFGDTITYNTLKGFNFENKSINDTTSPDKKIYFDNLKVTVLNDNALMGTSILNGAENVSVSASVDFSFANEITDNLADYFTVSEGESVLDSSKYTLTLSDDKKTVIVKVNGAMKFGTAYTVTAKAGFEGLTSPYSISFTTVEPVTLGIASSEIADGEQSAILQKWFHFTLNAPVNTEYFNEKSSVTDAGRKLITVTENGTEITAFDVLRFANNDKMMQLYINNPKAGAAYSVTISPEIASLPSDGSVVRGDDIVINYTYIKNPVTYEKVSNTDGAQTINFTVNGIGDASRNTYMEGYNLIVGVYEGNKLISVEMFTEPYNFIKNSKYNNVKSITYTPSDGVTVKAMLTRGLEFMNPYMEAVTVE